MTEFDWSSDDVLAGLNRLNQTEASAKPAAEPAAEAMEAGTAEDAFVREPDAETASPAEESLGGFEAPAETPVGSHAEAPAKPAEGYAETVPGAAAYTAPRQTAEPRQYSAGTVHPAYTTELPKTEVKVRKKRAHSITKGMVALALVCALLGGIIGAGGFYFASKAFSPADAPRDGKTVTLQQGAPRDTTAIQTVQVERGQLMTASQVYKASVNSTVGITTEITTTNYWGQSTTAAAGSGFILTEDGYILTNQHVIDNANSIKVAMYDGTTYSAELVGYDVNNDIAVLKIDAKGLTHVTLGDSSHLEVGDEVIAIGNPLGELTFSLTKGNVSALDRAVTLSSKVTMNLIQTDAAINSGNSGGALFNMYGEVVGITNAKYSSSGYSGEASIDNIGFAIPINSVRDIVTSIIEKGYISKPYIGVSVANVSEESQSYGMPKGAAIRSVEQDGPAAKAGLKENDIVTAVNGTVITSYEEFAQLITDSGIGAELELTVYRKGETLTLKVTVGEKIQQALPDAKEQSGTQSGQNVDPWGGNGSDPWGGGFPWGWGFGW